MFSHDTHPPATKFREEPAIFSLLLLTVSHLVNSATIATTQSSRNINNDNQARATLDRMSLDFANMIKRIDVDTVFYKGTGNDKMFFFAQVPAYSGNGSGLTGTAVVGYRVTDQEGEMSNDRPSYSLERFGKALVWQGLSTNDSMVFNSGNSTEPNTLTSNWATEIGASAPFNGSSPDFYHTLADQVFRMEICFQVKNLSSNNTLAFSNYPVAKGGPTTVDAGPPSGGNVGARWYDTTKNRAYICTKGNGTSAIWQPNGLKDVISIIITFAILDTNTRKMIETDFYQLNLSSLVNQIFPDVTDADLNANPVRLPEQIWNTNLENALSNGNAVIPKAAAAQIRIYQRFFYINRD